jgi:hypothetical protein
MKAVESPTTAEGAWSAAADGSGASSALRIDGRHRSGAPVPQHAVAAIEVP